MASLLSSNARRTGILVAGVFLTLPCSASQSPADPEKAASVAAVTECGDTSIGLVEKEWLATSDGWTPFQSNASSWIDVFSCPAVRGVPPHAFLDVSDHWDRTAPNGDASGYGVELYYYTLPSPVRFRIACDKPPSMELWRARVAAHVPANFQNATDWHVSCENVRVSDQVQATGRIGVEESFYDYQLVFPRIAFVLKPAPTRHDSAAALLEVDTFLLSHGGRVAINGPHASGPRQTGLIDPVCGFTPYAQRKASNDTRPDLAQMFPAQRFLVRMSAVSLREPAVCGASAAVRALRTEFSDTVDELEMRLACLEKRTPCPPPSR